MKNKAPFGYCDLCGRVATYRCVPDRYDTRTGKPLAYVHTVYCTHHRDLFNNVKERTLRAVITTNETIPGELFVFNKLS